MLPRLPTAYLFADEKGRPWTRKTRINRLRRAMKAVPAKVIPQDWRAGDDAHLPLDWHSLRHAVSTLLDARGHRSAAIGELLGQANVATRKRCTHAYAPEAVAIAADLEVFLAPPREEAGQDGR